MEAYHLYTLSLLAEIIDDVEKAKDLYEALPTLSKDVLKDIISDELLRGVKTGKKTISMIYPTSETDDQGLGWKQWPLLVCGVENAMKKNGTLANNPPVDVSNQTIGSDRSHIKFRAYKGFAMAHIGLVREEEKWVQQISHSVFAAAGQKGEGGHKDGWNQTYTVESKKELSDLKAKIDNLEKEIKDKDATIKSIKDDQQAKLERQQELNALDESYQEELMERLKKASKEAKKRVQQELDRLQRLEREKKHEFSNGQQELAILKEKHQALMSTNKDLKAKVERIQAKADALKEQTEKDDKAREEEKSKIHKQDLIIIDYLSKFQFQEETICQLERRIHDQQSEISGKDKEQKLTMKNMEDKKKKEKDLAEDLNKKGEEIQALRRKLDETEKQRQVCHEQVRDLGEKHNTVLKEIEGKKKEIDDINSQSDVNIKGYQEQLSNKDKKINNFLKEVTKLEGKVKQLEAKLVDSGEANSKRSSKLQAEFANADKERVKLLADLEKLVKENKILQTSIDTAKKEAEEKERHHAEIQQKLKAQLSNVLNEIKSPKDIDPGTEHVLDISTSINEVLRYLKTSSNETKDLKERLAKAEERYLIDGREIEDKESKFSKDLEDATQRVSELEEQLNNVQSQCQKEVSEKLRFEQELGTTKHALAEKKDLEDQIFQRQAEEVRLKEKNERLKNRLNRLEGEVTTLKEEYRQVQSSECQLQKKLIEVEKDREQEKDKTAFKDVQIAEKDRVVNELQKKLLETRNMLQDEEAKSQADIKSYSEQLKSVEIEQELLERQITDLTFEITKEAVKDANQRDQPVT
ncbi:hypothetical protein FDENT_4506 [Fusarium denticulatum]|uniref:Uncharacterized protein n=1 Tax=Fusarium denticulatum TaxID=48507 RepID=A0A8H5UJP0_9HYPO|nr:hypothetical protein FDENT_4506 [Fusarium denticulatum]